MGIGCDTDIRCDNVADAGCDTEVVVVNTSLVLYFGRDTSVRNGSMNDGWFLTKAVSNGSGPVVDTSSLLSQCGMNNGLESTTLLLGSADFCEASEA